MQTQEQTYTIFQQDQQNYRLSDSYINCHDKVTRNVPIQGEQRFELKRHLADTLQGRIYLGVDKTNGSLVVVKETWKQLVELFKSREGHRVAEDFVQEKKIMYYLSSQEDCNSGIVRILDEWEDKYCYYYAMEHCQGGELFEYIKKIHASEQMIQYGIEQQKLPQEPLKIDNEWIKSVRQMFRQIVDCVSWIHNKNICHLDLSLENIMIFDSKNMYVKIIDFGLSSYFPNGNFAYDKRVGKVQYMAPEVYARKVYDAKKADIWSLGVMLFMMLIGAPPYEVPTSTCPAFFYVVNGHLRKVLQHWKRLRFVTEDALDLMVKIFKFENERISMEDILKHPFLQVDFNRIDQNNQKIQVDAKEFVDKIGETGEDKIVNDCCDLQDSHCYHSSITTNSTIIPGSDKIDTTNIITNVNNVAQANNDNIQGRDQNNCPTILLMFNENKNDDNLTQTTIGGTSDIRHHLFTSNEANNFRNRILQIENETNIDHWRSFVNQIEAIINDKNHKRNQISNHYNPGSNLEFPPEGVVEAPDDEEIQLNMEIKELQWLHEYVIAKAT